MKEILFAELDGKYKYAIVDRYVSEWDSLDYSYTYCSLNYGNGRTESFDLPEWWHYT